MEHQLLAETEGPVAPAQTETGPGPTTTSERPQAMSQSSLTLSRVLMKWLPFLSFPWVLLKQTSN